jgi:hypothetical protein
MAQAGKKTTRHHSRRQVRDAGGRFLRTKPERTPQQLAETMRVLHQWKTARREYNEQLAAARKEERWSGLRSIGLFAAISAVMIGLLFAGAMTG